VAIAVGANRPARSTADWSLPVAALLGCGAIGLAIYLSYRFAEPIERFFGETAMSIFIRLSSFILLCIGVQIVWNGLSKLLLKVP
jgi:multiple antibiotic resistance protein